MTEIERHKFHPGHNQWNEHERLFQRLQIPHRATRMAFWGIWGQLNDRLYWPLLRHLVPEAHDELG